MKKTDFSVFDGLLRRNAALSEGMVIAPIVVCCDSLYKALMLSLAFACITFLTILTASFYPPKMVYAVKIILYALTAAVYCIPVTFLCEWLQPDVAAALGMYLPLLAFNSFIVLHSELYFYRIRRKVMLPALFFHILGFSLTAVIIGAVRELLAYGTLCNRVMAMPLVIQGIRAPWAGFILLGIGCALHRKFFRRDKEPEQGRKEYPA